MRNIRLFWLAIGIFGLFSLLLIQFYKIQIIEGEFWTKKANNQHYFIVKEACHRGTFYSNPIKNGHPEKPQSLVLDVQKFHLFGDPLSIPEEFREEISNQLAAFLDLSSEEKTVFRLHFDRASRSRKLAMWQDRQLKDTILKWWLPYARSKAIARNAIYFVSDYQRSYPYGKLLGQVLHTVQDIKDETTKKAIPTGGLELYFHKYLEGKQGRRRFMRSPTHALEMGEILVRPENGADIYLTINHHLQAIAEEEIAKVVKRAKAKAGWAAMMDPSTGEILVLAQYPEFFPSDYKNYFNDPQMTEHTRVKAVTDANEPGSVMKEFTVAIALLANEELERRGEKKLFDPEEKMPTADGHFPGRSKPIEDTHLHKFLNMDMAIQKSSNIYVARLTERIIERLGKEWYRQVLTDIFGFGRKTGIELPAESRGVLPTPGKKNVNGTFEWCRTTPHSMAFGHNLQVTTIQLLRAFSVLIGGHQVQPTLIRKIVKTNKAGKQQILVDHTGIKRLDQFPEVLPLNIADRVIKAMKYTTQPGGTATRANIPGFTELGKTSTAKKIVNGAYSEIKYVASFIGSAPAVDPKFILLVYIDEPEYGYEAGIGKKHHGGIYASIAFRDIAKRTLDYLGITPDDPYGYPSGDPRRDTEKADYSKESKRLQELYQAWNN